MLQNYVNKLFITISVYFILYAPTNLRIEYYREKLVYGINLRGCFNQHFIG